MKLTHKQAREMGIEIPPKAKGPSKAQRNGHEQVCGYPPREKDTPTQTSERLFEAACVAVGLPMPVAEYRFHPTRKWRFDWLFDGWLAVEIVGGVWTNGHHSRGQSQIDDFEKQNHAMLLGYAVLQFTPQQMESGEAFTFIRRVLDAREEQP